MLYNKPNKDVLEDLYGKFQILQDQLKDIAKNDSDNYDIILPRELRLFRIRLRLSLGVKFSFDTKYALVKDAQVKEAYIMILRCNEAWFSYEAMKAYCLSLGLTKTISTPVDIFTQQTLTDEFKLTGIINTINEILSKNVIKSVKAREDIADYINFLEGHAKGNLRGLLSATQTKIRNNESLVHKELLSIVYATRNIFVHAGETAKSGIKKYYNHIFFK